MKTSFRLVTQSLLTGVALSAFTSQAARAASECAQNNQCDLGFVCEVTCVPARCQADVDCARGMVCDHRTALAPNADGCGVEPACDAAASVEVDDSRCAPRWLLPCEIASDCGDGFVCEEQDSAARAMVCKAQSKTCESAVDCPIDWTCDAPPPADCATGVPDGGSAINAPDSGSSSAICEAGVAQKACRPPFADQSFPPRGGGIGLGEGPIPTNLPPSTSAAPHVDAASPETDSSATSDAGLPVATDTGLGSGDSGKFLAPTPAGKRDSGCSIQVGSPAARSSGGWFIALALGAALTYRARQRRPC